MLVERGSGVIAGFYTLANTAISAQGLPLDLARKLPKYPLIPGTLLGRLAIGQRLQGEGLGEFLLLDALRRGLETSRQAASYAVIVEAKDSGAAAFYLRYGFIQLADAPRKLFLPMKTIARLFPGAR